MTQPHADVSVEVLHVYREVLRDPVLLEKRARLEASWLRCFQEQADADGVEISVVILVDDFASDTAEEDSRKLADAWGTTGLPLDFIVLESSLKTDAMRLLDCYVGEPYDELLGVLGTAKYIPSVDPLAEGKRWLSNTDTRRSVPIYEHPATIAAKYAGARERASESRREPQSRAGRHSISLEVELWEEQGNEIDWACAWYAATWQTFRLGLGSDSAVVSSRSDRFLTPTALRTLTLLDPKFLPVEVAVRQILSRCVFSHRADVDKDSCTQNILDRLDYCFLGDR